MRLTAADLVFLQLFAANISRSGDPAVAYERAEEAFKMFKGRPAKPKKKGVEK